MSTQLIIEVESEIANMESRIEFLNGDRTQIVSVFGGTYNHGPYFRRLEKKNLKAKIKRRTIKLRRLKLITHE
tara:strand:+ start:1465 stop:1683 length:219 start_codon:yes stop_codon:yes gene_type:complete